MRFLVDAQLPPSLARYLTSIGHPSWHVLDVGLERATDGEIWSYGQAGGTVLVTKDEDFVTLRALQSKGPPVIWIRMGNTTNRALFDRLTGVLPTIMAALDRGETIVEVE